MAFNFNNNAQTNKSTMKAAIDNQSYHFTRRTQSKNIYLLTISKGLNPMATIT